MGERRRFEAGVASLGESTMRFEDIDGLLAPGYGRIESGVVDFGDGYATVCALARMPGCTSNMVEWWFGWLGGTDPYKLWHPRDHVWCDWENRPPGEYIGASHLVHEYLGGSGPLHKLRITFLDPLDFFDREAYARLDGVAICARIGLLEAPIDTGYMVHFVRNTDYGCEMRSRFFLGHVASRAPAEAFSAEQADGLRKATINDELTRGLHKHATEEMGYLAELLPILHRQSTESLIESPGVRV